MEASWISIIPPLLAIGLAVATRQVYLSLAAGVWIGWTILEGWNPIAGIARAIDESIAVLGDPGNAKVIVFTLVVGALISTIEASGGVRGFVKRVEERAWVTNGRRAQILTFILGIAIFIESNITVLVSGAVGRPLFDRFRISREQLAYLIDSTSAPICILIPLNAWGAYVLRILGELGVEDPLGTFIASIPFNFYALAAVLVAGITAYTGLAIGPMKKAEERTRRGQILSESATPMVDPELLAPAPETRIPERAINMIAPVVVMVLFMPLGLYITGDGDITRGSGSTSVLWAVGAGLATAWILLLAQRAFTIDALTKTALKGAGGLVGLAFLLLLALALSNVSRALGTGTFIASVTADLLPPVVFLPLVFLTAAAIALATGTSWGTFGIMLPIAVPAAAALGLPVAPFAAAALSGGIFGDHASPISDTTIISSMVAATDHIDHVRTQLPYAVTAAAIATIGFTIVGATL